MTDSITTQKGNGFFVPLGVLLILAGLAALTFPFMATLSVETFVGSFTLIAGLFTIFHAFAEKEWGGFLWQVIIGAVYLFAGIVFLVAPLNGALALTILLGLVFAAEGVLRMIMAFRVRPEKAWGWMLASGGVSLLLGVLVLGGIANGSSLAFIGVLFGINLVFAGMSFIAAGTRNDTAPAMKSA